MSEDLSDRLRAEVERLTAEAARLRERVAELGRMLCINAAEDAPAAERSCAFIARARELVCLELIGRRPCVRCEEMCDSQMEHIESNDYRPWPMCAGCAEEVEGWNDGTPTGAKPAEHHADCTPTSHCGGEGCPGKASDW